MALIRVTIDAVPLLVRSAGVKNYLYYWIRHLRQESHGVDIRLFPFLDEAAWLDHEGSVANPLATTLRLGMLFLLNQVPNDVAGWIDPDVDVFHACKLLNPPRRARLTATIHDMTCWLLPETHSPANVAADKRFAERIFQRADALIAVSEATRQDAAAQVTKARDAASKAPVTSDVLAASDLVRFNLVGSDPAVRTLAQLLWSRSRPRHRPTSASRSL